MRFIEDGPSIPDPLLQSRDEGRVVFFCGAGVSRARARLADFFGLAEAVIQSLGSAADSDACKVLQKAREIGEELDVTGLISADRVFSLLEREFTPSDIQSVVAKCLAPAANVDRSAHEILLRLARTPTGKILLVTTNFDRLFEPVGSNIAVFQPPRLPQPSRCNDLDGIVYLHGRVDPEYTRAEGSGLVLSSSDFGHAYLSEGWATEFFREIVREYVVVFVGYSADDPPVHYLLEGLRRSTDSLHGIYAFQSDGSAELTARWQHKGVKAITYSAADEHHALWKTLELWAIRADDPQNWRHSVINRAMAGPRGLKPHERGQVAHIVSTYEGTKTFVDHAPPAEWLCVFDPLCRYGRPGRPDWMSGENTTIDPFSLYGLDSDGIPQRSGDDSFARYQEVPANVWDAFAINDLDQQNVSRNNLAAVRGHLASNVPALPRRLACFAPWIASVANQPAAVWWAARQESLHPTYRRSIEWGLSKLHDQIDGNILRQWDYILEAWNNPPDDSKHEWYDLKRDLARDGWTLGRVRRFVQLSEPHLKVGTGVMSCPVPPALDEELRIFDLARIEVECPLPPHDADIPDEWLYHIVRGLRTNIEVAARLCEEVDDLERFHISPIAEDDRPDISAYQRTHGLSGCVISFASLYERLLDVDGQRAKDEFAAWPSDENTVFARLRFWASGKPKVASPAAFAAIILALPDDVFWHSYHQRDLLIVLATRWAELSDKDRQEIETRILRGPSRYDSEEEHAYTERLTWAVLERLQWLRTRGCEFSYDAEREIAKRRPNAPNWKPEYAERAAESREMRGGHVSIDTEHSALIREPIDSVLSRARELSGRSDSNCLSEHDPFAGLCTERPKRAYLALAHAARREEFPQWAWKTFLKSDSGTNDRSACSAVIAARLSDLPDEVLSQLIHSATWWLQKVSKQMSADFPDVFDRVVQRFIDVLKTDPDIATSAVLGSSRGRDWVTEAINAPVGHLVRAILDDPRMDASHAINARLQSIEQCLSLPGNPGRHAVTIASHYLWWLSAKAAEWTEQHLLAILDANDDEDREAFWAGFLWNPRVSSPALYLRIKDGLLTVAKTKNPTCEGYAESVACLLLTGWVSSAKEDGRSLVENSEFRDVLVEGGDGLRSHVLWQIGQKFSSEDAEERLKWQHCAREFFDEVWPRQRSVKSHQMTARLCEVLVANPDSFGMLINVVSPLLTRIHDATDLHFHFGEEAKDVIEAHPERFLHLLYSVLPEDAGYWPYGISESLDRIAEADESLLSDDRLLELRRKSNAR